LETTSTIADVISIPAWGPSGELRPKKVGNCRASASMAVSPPDAYRVAFTDDDVARRAAIAIIVKPASPSAGRAASAIAVSP